MIETCERFDFLAETAKDQYLYDEKGEKYLDFYAGIAVNSAGSCNEKVVAAVIDQTKDVLALYRKAFMVSNNSDRMRLPGTAGHHSELCYCGSM